MTTLDHPAAPPIPTLAEGIHIREATHTDNPALLALTRATPMAGSIALRIDRDPDFFALLRARGEPILFVATYAGELIGSISATIFPAHVAGTTELVAHIGDLKVNPAFTRRRLALKLAAALEDHLRTRSIDLCFNLVAAGNQRVITINQGRHGTPIHTPLGAFTVRELLPTPVHRRHPGCTIAHASPADYPAIHSLRQSFARTRTFARIPPPQPAGEILIARDTRNQIVATLTLADASNLRRNVLIGVTPVLRATLAVLRLIPGIRVPRTGQSLDMLYAHQLGCAPGHLRALRALIQHARTIAFARRAHFLSIALHQRDPLAPALHRIPGFTFYSLISATALIHPERAATLLNTVPYEDFAFV